MNLGLGINLGSIRRTSGAPAVTGFIASSHATSASTSSLVVPVPTGAIAGDILMAFGSSVSGIEHNTPAGWTDRLTNLGFTLRSLASYDGTTPNYTFTTATAQAQSIIILAFRGFDFGAATGVSGNAVDPTPANLTVPVANSIVVQIATSTAAAHTYSMPAGWTSRIAVTANRSITAFQRDAVAPSGVLTSTAMTRTAGASNSRGLAFSLSPKP